MPIADKRNKIEMNMTGYDPKDSENNENFIIIKILFGASLIEYFKFLG